MSLYDRTRKRLRARRNKLEAEVKALREVRALLERHAAALHEVRTEQESVEIEERESEA